MSRSNDVDSVAAWESPARASSANTRESGHVTWMSLALPLHACSQLLCWYLATSTTSWLHLTALRKRLELRGGRRCCHGHCCGWRRSANSVKWNLVWKISGSWDFCLWRALSVKRAVNFVTFWIVNWGFVRSFMKGKIDGALKLWQSVEIENEMKLCINLSERRFESLELKFASSGSSNLFYAKILPPLCLAEKKLL